MGGFVEETPLDTDRLVVDLHVLWPYMASLCIVMLLSLGHLSHVVAKWLGIRAMDFFLGIVASVVVIVIHEFLHAAVAVALASVTVEYGLTRVGPLPVAYVGMHGDIPIEAYRWVVLAPLLVLTPVLVALAALVVGLSQAVSSALLLAAVLNAAGSCGDLTIFFFTVDCPPGTLIRDRGTVVEVLAPKGWRPKFLPVLAWVSACIAFLIAIAAFSVCLAVMAGGKASLGPITLARVVVEYERNRGFTIGCEVSPGTALLAAVLAALVIATRKPKPVYRYFASRLKEALPPERR